MAHDQRFKTIISEFFEWFMELFFPNWAVRFDFEDLEWLDKEVYPNPPEGQEHVLDLVARLPCQPNDQASESISIVLVHVEIESPDHSTR